MRTKVNVSVGVKTNHGVMQFGTVQWIEGNVLMIQTNDCMDVGSHCEVKLDLERTGGWIYAVAQIIHASPFSSNKECHSVVRMMDLSEQDRDRLAAFTDSKRGQSNTRRPIAKGVSFIGKESAPTMETTIPIRDPQYQLSTNNRRLTVRWRDSHGFRQDWALHLAHGRLPAKCPKPLRRAFMLRVVLPNGFAATFPAEVGEHTNEGWNAKFLIPMSARRRIEAFVQGAPRRSVLSAK
jgi:hypothetical protein